MVAAQAAAQVERARAAANRRVRTALSAKPKLLLHVTLDAPKVAVPVPAPPDGSEGAPSLPPPSPMSSLQLLHLRVTHSQQLLHTRAYNKQVRTTKLRGFGAPVSAKCSNEPSDQ